METFLRNYPKVTSVLGPRCARMCDLSCLS